ncbi:MAG: thiamine pyrophosphate-dependent enzyme [Anaerolineae bacterium]|nr:thiamine pyrophosphate-dependent enzyme [Anaerolineae bacterium]
MAVKSETRRITAKDYRVDQPIDWCPGCGDFGILSALQQALARLGLEPHRVAIVGGIGCSGKSQYHIGAYGVHTLHGRLLPYATGIKLANPELTVVAVGGDGDGMAIGAGHFVNAGRRNVNMTYILFNNEVYGLTKGQASPTLPLGLQTKSLPEPNAQGRVNSLMLALSAGFTWIGRGYAFNVRQLVGLMQKAIEHPGLAYLDVLQPCPTYNNLHNKDWYAGKDRGDRPRVYALDDEDYDPVIAEGADEETVVAKMGQVIGKAMEWGDRIATGVFLENRNVSTFEERLGSRSPSYHKHAPALRPIADAEGRSLADLSDLFAQTSVTRKPGGEA